MFKFVPEMESEIPSLPAWNAPELLRSGSPRARYPATSGPVSKVVSRNTGELGIAMLGEISATINASSDHMANGIRLSNGIMPGELSNKLLKTWQAIPTNCR